MMDEVVEEDKKTRATRKRKSVPIIEETIDSDDSSDNYIPPKDLEGQSSDDSISEKKEPKKKKRKTGHNDDELGAARKESHQHLEGRKDNCKKKSRRKRKVETNHYDAKHKASRKNVKRAKLLLNNKSRAQGRKKIKKEIGSKCKEEEKESQEVEEASSKKDLRPGPYSVIGFWYIASGFVKDLTALLKAFDSLDSWRFKDFATCWQKYKFSLIFRGRYCFKELLEFTEEVYFWTKKFLSDKYSLKWRVGALYTLYGLHYKIAFRQPNQVRLEIKEYEYLESLAKRFHSCAQNPDPAYIFYKMKTDGVFSYVATVDEMGQDFYSVEKKRAILDYDIQFSQAKSPMSDTFVNHEHSIQKTLLQDYEKVKSQTLGHSKRPLSYIQASIMDEVSAMLAELCDDAPDPPASITHAGVDQGLTASAEMSEIGQRKREVREKAAALNTTDDFFKRKQLRSPQKSSKKKDRRQRRKSLSVSDSVSDDTDAEEDVPSDCDESDKVMKLSEIMEFMQPPEEGALDVPLRGFSNKNAKVKNRPTKKSDSHSDGSCDTPNSENISLASESPQPGSEELEISIKHENTASLQQVSGRNSAGKCSSQKAAGQSEASPHIKTRTTSRQPKARNSSPTGSHSKTVSNKPRKNSQTRENNKVLNGKSVPKNASKTGVTSVKGKERKSRPENVEKMPNENTLEGKTRGLEGEKSKPENSHEQINSVHGKEGRSRELNRHLGASSCSERKAPLTRANTKTYSPAQDKSLFEAQHKAGNEDEVISDNVPNFSEREAITSVNECKEVLNNERRTSEKVCKKFPIIESAISTSVFLDICNDRIITNFGRKQSDSSGTQFDDLDDTTDSLQGNHSDGSPVGKVLQVEILPTIPKKKKLQSLLKAQGMVYLEVHFHDGDDRVHFLKYKMSEKDLKTLQNNKEKLKEMKKKLQSFVPQEYKDHELQLHLNVPESVTERIETSEQKQHKEGSETPAGKHSNPRQGSHCSKENPFRNPESSSGNHSESSEHLPVLPQVTASVIKTESSSGNHSKSSEHLPVLPQVTASVIKTEDAVPQVTPLTSQTQVGVSSSHTTEGNDAAPSLSHTIGEDTKTVAKVLNEDTKTVAKVLNEDTKTVAKVLNVQMLITTPKKKTSKALCKTGDTYHISLDFQLEGVTVHHTKYKISKKDLETLQNAVQNNNKKLLSMKTKFRSFLPLEYQKYEMQLQLIGAQSLAKTNETPTEHCRQVPDSTTLTHPSATPSTGNNATPLTKDLTPLSQEASSKTITISETDMSCSQSLASEAPPQKVPNISEVKGNHSLKPPYPGQDNSNTTAQASLASHSLPWQSSTSLPVRLLLKAGGPHPELSDTLTNTSEDNTHNRLADDKNTIPEQLQMQNQTLICTEEAAPFDNWFCQDPAYVVTASMEGSKTVRPEYHIMPLEEHHVPVMQVECNPVAWVQCEPNIGQVNEAATVTQLYGGAPMDWPSPKLSNSERSTIIVHEDNLEEPSHDLTNDTLGTSSPAGKRKHNNANLGMCLKSNVVKEDTSYSRESSNTCTNEPDTDNSTVLWKAQSNSNATSDKNLLTSVPFGNSSGHFSVMREGQEVPRKTVRMTSHFSLNTDPGKYQASISNNMVKDIVFSSSSNCTTKSVSASPSTDVSVSKPKSSSVCSFYFFSKTKKCDFSMWKQARLSSGSGAKKLPVPFLFMEKMISNKKH